MKDALIIFIVGLFVIIVALIAIDQVKEYKRSNKPEERFVCKNGGQPDYRCFPIRL